MSYNNFSLPPSIHAYPYSGGASSSSAPSSSSSSAHGPLSRVRHVQMSKIDDLSTIDPRSCQSLVVDCDPTVTTSEKIAAFIEQALNLRSFHFQAQEYEVWEFSQAAIINSLSYCPKLERVKISDQAAPLAKLPLETLANVISKSRTITHLEIGDINEVSQEGLIAVFEAIEKVNRSVKIVKLEWDSGTITPNLTAIAPAIAIAIAQNPTLEELVLDGTFQMTEEAIAQLGSALPHNTGLRTLKLDACSLGNNQHENDIDGFTRLMDGLKGNKSLQEVTISFLRTMGGLATEQALFDFLTTNRSIKELNLTHINGLDFECYQRIFEALRYNRTLEEVDLENAEYNPREDGHLMQHVKTLQDSIENNRYYSACVSNFFEPEALAHVEVEPEVKELLDKMEINSHNGRIRNKTENFLGFLLNDCLEEERVPMAARQRLSSEQDPRA